MTARTRRRSAARLRNRRADWRFRVAFRVVGVTVVLPLPILRRMAYDAELRTRLARSVVDYRLANRLEGAA